MVMQALRLEFQTPSADKWCYTYLGRNSLGVCSGISVTPLTHCLMFSPINSKGYVSHSCNIDIPRNAAVLRHLGQYLIAAAAAIDENNEQEGS